MDDRILKKSQALIERYGTRDPFEIADRLGYYVRLMNTRKQKGFCKILLGNCFIFINANLSPQMKRMTCAHELGHLLLHKDALKKEVFLAEMELFDITDRRELEANQFAASLLISDEELLQVLQEGHDVVAAASIPDVNVNMLMVKLLTMNQYGYEFDLPFFPKAEFMGTIRDSEDLV